MHRRGTCCFIKGVTSGVSRPVRSGSFRTMGDGGHDGAPMGGSSSTWRRTAIWWRSLSSPVPPPSRSVHRRTCCRLGGSGGRGTARVFRRLTGRAAIPPQAGRRPAPHGLDCRGTQLARRVEALRNCLDASQRLTYCRQLCASRKPSTSRALRFEIGASKVSSARRIGTPGA